jgi:hypothetical protein
LGALNKMTFKSGQYGHVQVDHLKVSPENCFARWSASRAACSVDISCACLVMAPGPGFNNNLNTERSIVGTFSQMSFLSESSPGGRLKLSAITDDTRIGSPPVTDGKKQPFSRAPRAVHNPQRSTLSDRRGTLRARFAPSSRRRTVAEAQRDPPRRVPRGVALAGARAPRRVQRDGAQAEERLHGQLFFALVSARDRSTFADFCCPSRLAQVGSLSLPGRVGFFLCALNPRMHEWRAHGRTLHRDVARSVAA